MIKLDPAAEALIGPMKLESRDGGPPLTINLTRALVEKARLFGWSSGELIAEAVRLQLPDATGIVALGKSPPRVARRRPRRRRRA
jgi:hypothetical protein